MNGHKIYGRALGDKKNTGCEKEALRERERETEKGRERIIDTEREKGGERERQRERERERGGGGRSNPPSLGALRMVVCPNPGVDRDRLPSAHGFCVCDLSIKNGLA